jgi:Protein of unknown function (DUF3800)
MNPTGGLGDFFPFLFPDGRGLVAVLAGYFDESEQQQGNWPICVGGFLFKPSGYKRFRRKWNRDVLRFRGRRVAPFHMTDLCSGHGVYEGLTISDRVVILENAVEAIVAHTYSGVAIQFYQSEFERKAPADWPLRFGSIYTAACQMCLRATAYWLNRDGCQMNVYYVFEEGHEFENEAHLLLSAVGKHEDVRRLLRYRKHAFEPKTEVGLQAADFFAWVCTKASTVGASGEPIPRAFVPFLGPVTVWADKHNDQSRIHEFTGPRLERFINDCYR